MSFIFQACEFLILILLFGWLTHWLYKKKKRWWALLSLVCVIANTAALVNPNSYATSEPATEETATKERSTDSSSKEKQSKEAELKKEEARRKEEAAQKEQQKKEEQKKAAAKKATEQKEKAQVTDLPQYNGNPYVEINDNTPYFPESDLNTHSFEKYSALQ